MGLFRKEADAVKKAVAKEHGVDSSEVKLTGGISLRTGYRQSNIWIPRKEVVGSASTDTKGVRWGTIGGGRDRHGRA
jgi:hypothetical protein